MQLRTTKQAADLIDLIDRLKDALFKTDMVSFKNPKDNVIMVPYLSDLSLAVQQESLRYLDRTKEEISNLQKIKLTLAINPDQSLLDKMFIWLKDATGYELLMDVTVNPGILGGILITYKGLYRDLSVKSKIDSYFKRFTSVYELLRS
jgi:F0F1-type ATP synthase delta subunit